MVDSSSAAPFGGGGGGAGDGQGGRGKQGPQLARRRTSGDAAFSPSTHKRAALTRLHQHVARQPELLELAVELPAPASEQEAPKAAGAVLQHPVDGGGGLALRWSGRPGGRGAPVSAPWSLPPSGGMQTCPHRIRRQRGRTEWRPATPSAPSRHFVVNTLIAPPKKYCTPRHPMYCAYCGATLSGKPWGRRAGQGGVWEAEGRGRRNSAAAAHPQAGAAKPPSPPSPPAPHAHIKIDTPCVFVRTVYCDLISLL